jgi:hypothetical protein
VQASQRSTLASGPSYAGIGPEFGCLDRDRQETGLPWFRTLAQLEEKMNKTIFFFVEFAIFEISISTVIKIKDVFASTLVRHPCISWFLSSFAF